MAPRTQWKRTEIPSLRRLRGRKKPFIAAVMGAKLKIILKTHSCGLSNDRYSEVRRLISLGILSRCVLNSRRNSANNLEEWWFLSQMTGSNNHPTGIEIPPETTKFIEQIRARIATVVVGQDVVVERLLVALFTGMPLLQVWPEFVERCWSPFWLARLNCSSSEFNSRSTCFQEIFWGQKSSTSAPTNSALSVIRSL